MAAKSYIITFFLIVSTIGYSAQSDEQQLKEWTIKNESKLLDKYRIIESVWFVETCMSLSITLRLHAIDSCQLFQSEEINAYVFNNGHVYFSTAMMKLVKNKHQWASILAHEYAHIKLSHYIKTLKKLKKPGIFFPKKRVRKLLKKHEQEADIWSHNQLKKYNFDPGQINYFLQRVINITGDKNNHKHLKLSKRIDSRVLDEIIDQELIKQLNRK